jgi:hypothetical protein
MNARSVSIPKHLSNSELIAALPLLVRRESQAIAELVAHLAEMDTRRLYRDQAFSSMHQYCVEALYLSEGAAYKRIAAARAARDFPLVLELLADGKLHLSAICLLAPHLTEENHRSLLEAAVHRSKREVELLLAEQFPRPDVPQSLRKLPVPPQPRPQLQPQTQAAVPIPQPASPVESSALPAPNTELPALAVAAPAFAASVPPPRLAVVAPLSPERYKLQLTISQKTRQRLEEARDLLGHQVPDGDLAEVVDRALDLLVHELRKKKYAETGAPREPRPAKENDCSRRIPNHVKRAVAERDGHQCTYVSPNGHRCSVRRRLEFHHIDPHGQGGPSTVLNVALRCSIHNGYAAEMDYGTEHVARRIAEARQHRRDRAARALPPGTARTNSLFDFPPLPGTASSTVPKPEPQAHGGP